MGALITHAHLNVIEEDIFRSHGLLPAPLNGGWLSCCDADGQFMLHCKTKDTTCAK